MEGTLRHREGTPAPRRGRAAHPGRLLPVLLLLVPLLPACGRRPAPAERPAPAAEVAAAAPKRVHLFPAGAETLRVEIHYVTGASSPRVANGVTVSLGSARPLTLQSDLDSQEEWTCVDSLSGRDLNGDGNIEAVLARSNGGSCGGCRSLILVSAGAGEPRVISPDPQDDRVPREVADLRHDGRYQLLVLDTSWEEAHGLSEADSPRPLRVWAWNGRAYVDSTGAFPRFVVARMRLALAEACALEGSSAETRWLGRLAEYVLYADMLGRGRAALDTLRAHVAANPPTEPEVRATASEVEVALLHRVARRT